MTYKAENDHYVLEVDYDEFTESPRTSCDNLGTMVCWHRRYSLGDDHSYSDPREFIESLASEFTDRDTEEMTNAQLWKIIDRNVIILQVYMYEHSAVSLSTRSFLGRAHHAEWDSGPVGYVYVTKSQVRQEYNVKRVSPKLRQTVERVMSSEVEEYGQYVNGECYAFTLSKKVYCDCSEDCAVHGDTPKCFHTEEIENCGGFIGYDFKTNGIAESLPNDARELVSMLV